MLDRTRRNLSVGKEPVQVAGAGAIESELDRSVSESRYDPRLEIDLQVDHKVEAPVRQLGGGIGEGHQAPGTIEDDYLIDRSVPAHERRRAGLNNPGDTSVGIRTFERVDHRQHVQDQYFEFLTVLGVAPQPVEWDLGPWPQEREWQRRFVASIDGPIASIVVATSKPEKDWFPERWAVVCDALHEKFGMRVVLVGGRSARELAAERVVMERAKHKPRSELGSGLRNLVSILDASALVLSPDTGPLHMSVALDTPVISLMGYTNPKRTGPYRRFQDLIIDAYGEPGEDYPITMENRAGRMRRIETRHVLDKVQLWQDRYAGGRAR